MKKVIVTVVKHYPYVTTLLGILMWLGLHLATDGAGNIDNYSFVSDPYGLAMSDVLSMFGHGDNGHLFSNMVKVVVFCTAAEILLGSRKFTVAIICAMFVQLLVEEVIGGLVGIGASGWLMATPGLMLWAAMRKVQELEGEMQHMVMPSMFYSVNVLQVIWDINNMNNPSSNVGHVPHIIGFCVGMLFVLAALPIAVKRTAEEIRMRHRRKIARKNWAIRQLQQIADGTLLVQHPRKIDQLRKLAA